MFFYSSEDKRIDKEKLEREKKKSNFKVPTPERYMGKIGTRMCNVLEFVLFVEPDLRRLNSYMPIWKIPLVRMDVDLFIFTVANFAI